MNYDEHKTYLLNRLKEYVNEAIITLYDKDSYLISIRPTEKQILSSDDKKHHVGERSIVFRFAHYLQNLLEKDDEFSGYNLDCEYNRNGQNQKALPSFPNGTYPDVIIHRRGSNKDNLLVIEFKTYWNSNQRDDKRKIEEFVDAKGLYNFNLGMTILIKKEECIIEKYENYDSCRTLETKVMCLDAVLKNK